MYTIGEFSKLCHVSARMLRHYDAIGLLRPASINDETGYRYYDAAQLATLTQIETLKSYGFPLSEIAALLRLKPEELSRRIHHRRLQAYEELHSLRQTLRRMEKDIVTMEGTAMIKETHPIIVMEQPAQNVFCLRRTIEISQIGELFDELLEAMRKNGLTRAGACQLVYLGDEFSYEKMDVEAQVQVEQNEPPAKHIPAQLCLAAHHTGSYDNTRYVYDQLRAWMAQHPEYKVCGPGVERYIKDVDMVTCEDELETGILFPVEKVPEA